jgi:PPP family 3-phenylpropionic acid transporter
VARPALAYVVFFVAIGASIPYLPVFYRSLGLSLADVGLLAALTAATGLVAGPAGGVVADTFDRRGRALPVAAFLGAVGAALLWAAGEWIRTRSRGLDPGAVVLVAAAAVAIAASSSGIGPQLDARSVGLLDGDRARYGRLRAWGSFSFIVTAAAIGPLLNVTGPAGLFLFYVPALAATGVVALGLPSPDALPAAHGHVRASPIGPGVADLLAIPALRAYLLAGFVGWAALNGTNAFLSVDLVALGAPPSIVGVAWAVGAGLEIPVMWAFPSLAARFGSDRLLVVGALILAVRAFGCALAPTPELLVAVSAIQGPGFALSFVGGVTHVARLAPRELGATGQGLFGGATIGLGAIAGSGVGALIVGAIGLPGVFALSGIASLVSAGLIVRALALVPRSPAAAAEPPLG